MRTEIKVERQKDFSQLVIMTYGAGFVSLTDSSRSVMATLVVGSRTGQTPLVATFTATPLIDAVVLYLYKSKRNQ